MPSIRYTLLLCGLLGLPVAGTLGGAPPPGERFRGGKVEWTRLKTSDRYWNRHSAADGELLRLMRQNTSLNIAQEWSATRADDLTALCAYPFVYAADISMLSEPEGKNLAEYLKRSGFLFIDACINQTINPDPRKFFQRQIDLLTKYLPDLRVVDLSKEHEVFSIYFQLRNRPPMTREVPSWSMTENFPLRALMVGDRMVGMLSLSGLQCAWSGVGIRIGFPDQPVEAMKMATNIYLYSMTR